MGKKIRQIQKTGGVQRVSLVLAIVLAVALIASVAANVYSSKQTDIFWQEEIGKGFQNGFIWTDEASGNTFLGTYDNTAAAFDAGGNLLWSNQMSGASGALTYDSERDWVIVGSQDRNIYIYQGADGTPVNTYSLSGRVYDMDYDQPTGRLLVSSGISKTKHQLLILDIETGEALTTISLSNTARTAKFSADRQHIVYGTNRGRVTLTDLKGETLAEVKATGDIYSLAVAAETGEVAVIDKTGQLFKYDSELNEQFRVELAGEGRAVGMSADGRWIAAGTREGDIHILDGSGNVQYSTVQGTEVSQLYFGKGHSYVVTLSEKLFGFSAERLENLGLMSTIHDCSVWVILALAVLLAAALIAAFPRSRALAIRFFKSMYRHRVAYIMLAPSIILILIFNYYNVFQAFYYAFTDWSLATKTMREVKFIGLDNFVKMFTEGYFLLGVKNLVIIIVCSFVKLLTVPLLLAEVVFAMRTKTGASSRRRYWFRLLLVMPMVVPGVVNALMWKNIYDPNIGALNSFLDAVGLSSWKHSWLGDESTALWAIIFMGFPWVNSFAFLVYYGGLINIPVELFEAAKVDGSRPLWNFLHIHVPLISPQLKMLIITTFISSVQDYGGVYLLTAGGPGTATYVPGLELYYAATKFGQYGYACAMGLVMFIVILLGSLLNMRMKTQELN